MENKNNSIRKFEITYLPNRILNRLEEDLCSLLGITENRGHSHILHKEQDCQKRGLIELHPAFPYSLSDLIGRIKEFYAEEGYKVNGECQ